MRVSLSFVSLAEVMGPPCCHEYGTTWRCCWSSAGLGLGVNTDTLALAVGVEISHRHGSGASIGLLAWSLTELACHFQPSRDPLGQRAQDVQPQPLQRWAAQLRTGGEKSLDGIATHRCGDDPPDTVIAPIGFPPHHFVRFQPVHDVGHRCKRNPGARARAPQCGAGRAQVAAAPWTSVCVRRSSSPPGGRAGSVE